MNDLSDVLSRFKQLINTESHSFTELCAAFHELEAEMELRALGKQRDSIDAIKNEWAAQSIQFAADINTYLSKFLLQKYNRADDFTLLDVGAGTCSGTDLFHKLYSTRMIWSKAKITAIDHIDIRRDWVKLKYPDIDYIVGDIYNVEQKHDIVVASHVIEHVPDPEKFLEKIVSLSNHLCIVFAPYKEKDRIAAHPNFIDDKLFRPYKHHFKEVINSMGWHPAKPKDRCIMIGIKPT